MTLVTRFFVKIFFFAESPFVSWEYETLALNLLAGKGYFYHIQGQDYYAYLPPLYAYFCFGIYKLFGHHPIIIIIFQCLFSSLLVVTVFYTTQMLFKNRFVAYLSALMTMLHPGLLYYDIINLHPLSLGALLIFLMGIVFIHLLRTLTPRWAMFYGLIAGLIFLERSVAAIFIGISLLILLFSAYRRKKTAIFLVTGVTALLVIAPWMTRNTLKYGTLLVANNGGLNFWKGNNPETNGSNFNDQGEAVLSKLIIQQKEKFRLYREKNELERDRFFWSEAFSYIQSDPIRYIKLFFKKLSSFVLMPTSIAGVLYSASQRLSLSIWYGFISFFLIFTLILHCFKKNQIPKDFHVYILLFVCFAVTHSLFYFEGRHRVPTDLILILYLSQGVNFLRLKLAVQKGI